MPRITRTIRRALALGPIVVAGGWVAGGCVAGGCAAEWTPGRTASSGALESIDPADRRTIVIGRLDDPTHSSVGWSDIGSEMTGALSRSLIEGRAFSVVVEPGLAAAVEQVLAAPIGAHAAGLDRLAHEHADVRFVVTGRVTDFTAADRSGEAIVAIQLNVVDLESGRLVFADQVHGTARSRSDLSADEFYAGVGMGSYLFWQTPLGRAADEAVRTASHRLAGIAPQTTSSLRVVRRLDGRRFAVSVPSATRVRPGDIYYVCRYDDHDGTLRPVSDRDTRQPLRARIDSVGATTTTAWMLGYPPPAVPIRGAVLTRRLPRPAPVPPREVERTPIDPVASARAEADR